MHFHWLIIINASLPVPLPPVLLRVRVPGGAGEGGFSCQADPVSWAPRITLRVTHPALPPWEEPDDKAAVPATAQQGGKCHRDLSQAGRVACSAPSRQAGCDGAVLCRRGLRQRSCAGRNACPPRGLICKGSLTPHQRADKQPWQAGAPPAAPSEAAGAPGTAWKVSCHAESWRGQRQQGGFSSAGGFS